MMPSDSADLVLGVLGIALAAIGIGTQIFAALVAGILIGWTSILYAMFIIPTSWESHE
jgi:hypothetical protein